MSDSDQGLFDQGLDVPCQGFQSDERHLKYRCRNRVQHIVKVKTTEGTPLKVYMCAPCARELYDGWQLKIEDADGSLHWVRYDRP